MIPSEAGMHELDWRGLRLRVTVEGGRITYARAKPIVGGRTATWVAR